MPGAPWFLRDSLEGIWGGLSSEVLNAVVGGPRGPRAHFTDVSGELRQAKWHQKAPGTGPLVPPGMASQPALPFSVLSFLNSLSCWISFQNSFISKQGDRGLSGSEWTAGNFDHPRTTPVTEAYMWGAPLPPLPFSANTWNGLFCHRFDM